jgi:hypothetical protein
VNVPEPFFIGIILPVVVDLVCLSGTKNEWLRCRNLICKEMWPVIVGQKQRFWYTNACSDFVAQHQKFQEVEIRMLR